MAVLAACAFYKPLHVLLPESSGMICATDTLCVEDMSTLAEATQLRYDAMRFVS